MPSALIPLLLHWFVVTTPIAETDTYLLPIGQPGRVMAQMGALVDTRTGNVVTLEELARQARRARFLFLGEQHATAEHQAMHAQIIRALSASGRSVVIGLEMYTRPRQVHLDQWTAGKIEEAAFLQESDWKGQWGFDFAFYRPVFQAARDLNLPMVALNVPREWVRTVGRGGFTALGLTERLQLPPEIDLSNREHRRIFASLMGGHPLQSERMDNVYAAQVLWDEGMADTALKVMERLALGKDPVMVVLAGSGHVMYGQGINWRIERRRGGSGLSVVMLTSDNNREVSRGIADYVFLSPTKPTGG